MLLLFDDVRYMVLRWTKENSTYKFAIGFTFTNVSPVHHPFGRKKHIVMVLGARTIGLDRNELNVGFNQGCFLPKGA
jgi:hypothetical protein